MGDDYTSRNSKRKRSCGDDSDDDPTGKKRKNREAARKCREKKESETKKLKEENIDLIKTNKELNSRKEELERKVQEYIEELKMHRARGCKLPPPVSKIVNSYENCDDFLPVGVIQTKRRAQNNAPNLQEVEPLSSVIPPTVTGLFSGHQVPATAVEQLESRGSLSKSPSRSPPLQSQPSQYSSQMMAMNPSPHLASSLSWASLHQKTGGGPTSPGLSPAQTVPNIDTHPELNGFPDIDEEVQNAQRDSGLILTGHSDHPVDSVPTLQAMPQRSFSCLPSLECINTNSTYPSSVQTAQPSSVLYCYQVSNDNAAPPKANDTLSMNHTAELVSQAMSTFENSEISEGLKLQMARISMEGEESNNTGQNNHNFAQNDQLQQIQILEASSQVMQQELMTPSQMQIESSFISEQEQLWLDLARGQEKITLQYHGRNYDFTNEQFCQLVKRIKMPKTVQIVSAQAHTGETSSGQVMETGPGTIYDSLQLEFNDDKNQYSSQVNSNGSIDGEVLPVATPQTQMGNDALLQSNQLPTTVLSIIQDYSSSVQPGSTGGVTLDSDDYSHNLTDLPSLSLTEDHTNIFEKKRRLQ